MKNKIIDGRRQGDVLLIARQKQDLPVTHNVARDGKRIVLMHGEVTGHAHAILDRDVELLETGTGDAAERWLRVGSRGATLVHEEHSAHALMPNTVYEQWYQYEYSPAEIQRVAD